MKWALNASWANPLIYSSATDSACRGMGSSQSRSHLQVRAPVEHDRRVQDRIGRLQSICPAGIGI